MAVVLAFDVDLKLPANTSVAHRVLVKQLLCLSTLILVTPN